MDGNRAALRHVALRVRHDCPLASLSQDLPNVELHAWSAHLREVVEVRCRRQDWPAVAAAARRRLAPDRLLEFPEGGLAVWTPDVPPTRSISRILETNGMLWLQPMRARRGWEEYEAIAFGPGGEQPALDALGTRWDVQVARRRDVGPEDLLGGLFQSLRPILDSPTARQAQALVTAWRAGYYQAPRGATTAKAAKRLGLSRSAFEERLRGAENRVLAAVAAHLEGRAAQGQLASATEKRRAPVRGA